VVGEADGRAKYAVAAAERGGNSEALLDVLQAERRREQRLREVGAEVVRWSARDVLDQPSARSLAQRIRAAIILGREQERFTGVVVPVVFPLATENKVHKAE
jgi:cysteine synthase